MTDTEKTLESLRECERRARLGGFDEEAEAHQYIIETIMEESRP